MRNLSFAARLATLEGLDGFAMLLAFVGTSRAARETQDAFTDFKALLLPQLTSRVGAVSYEQLAVIARTHGENELAHWIDVRIEQGLATAQANALTSDLRGMGQ